MPYNINPKIQPFVKEVSPAIDFNVRVKNTFYIVVFLILVYFLVFDLSYFKELLPMDKLEKFVNGPVFL
jgi:hypothetical protein